MRNRSPRDPVSPAKNPRPRPRLQMAGTSLVANPRKRSSGNRMQEIECKDTKDADEVTNEVMRTIDGKGIYEKLEKSNKGKNNKIGM
ncbi:unnamed protein product [Citrullus colocynthis]|uniref:Uncharacterized protein n=1 Tax=Citrullus colocynthis TaxID=252529 RepID=A0ABP0Z3G3_9ROSI